MTIGLTAPPCRRLRAWPGDEAQQRPAGLAPRAPHGSLCSGPWPPPGAADQQMHAQRHAREAEGQAERPCLPLSLPRLVYAARTVSHPIRELLSLPLQRSVALFCWAQPWETMSGWVPPRSQWCVSAGDAGEDPELGDH